MFYGIWGNSIIIYMVEFMIFQVTKIQDIWRIRWIFMLFEITQVMINYGKFQLMMDGLAVLMLIKVINGLDILDITIYI